MVDDGHQHATSGGGGANATASRLLAGSGRHHADPLDPLDPLGLANVTATGPKPHSASFAGTTFPASRKTLLKPLLISQEKFHWDQREQGHILGAFFYGYILFQIPGARMAERVGARWIMMASTAGSAIISLVFPWSTQLGSIHLLMVLRFVMGLCQSAFFPAGYVFFCRWLPESERSILLPIMFIGSNMGSISSYIMSSYLISLYGWPSVFYVSGMICLLVTVMWLVFGSNGPQDNWLITAEECKYIEDNMSSSTTPTVSGSASVESALNADLGGQAAAAAAAAARAGRQASPAVDYQRAAIANSLVSQSKLCDTSSIQRQQQQQQLQLQQLGCLKKQMSKSKSASDLNPNLQQQQQQRLALLASLQEQQQQQQHEKEPNSKLGPQAAPGARKLSWCKLLKSVPVWVLIFSMYGNEWSQVVLTYELPTYLNKALDIPIDQNGVINSFFQLSYAVASPILSSLGAFVLDKHLCRMRKIHVRKLFQSLATFGQLACFVAVPICGANRGLIIMFMFSAIVFKACANAGDIMVSGDLSPEFAGTIFALANSLGNTAGFVVPLLAGVIVGDQYKREQWTPFWLTTASIMGTSGLIFLLLGETSRQDYSRDYGGQDEEMAGSRLAADSLKQPACCKLAAN